jgi:hypothetical protein
MTPFRSRGGCLTPVKRRNIESGVVISSATFTEGTTPERFAFVYTKARIIKQIEQRINKAPIDHNIITIDEELLSAYSMT